MFSLKEPNWNVQKKTNKMGKIKSIIWLCEKLKVFFFLVKKRKKDLTHLLSYNSYLSLFQTKETYLKYLRYSINFQFTWLSTGNTVIANVFPVNCFPLSSVTMKTNWTSTGCWPISLIGGMYATFLWLTALWVKVLK